MEMCGRYTVFTEEEVIEMREIINEVNRRYLNTAEHAGMKTGEIFPTNVAPVLAGAGEMDVRLMSWGFPKWQGSGVIINARAETALEKPLFRSSLLQRRCVVPSTGFYEWRHEEGKKRKEKYLIRRPGSSMLYMAGLFDTFRDGQGHAFTGFVILTAEANRSIAPLHDRMPVVLSGETMRRWLGSREEALRLLEAPDETDYVVTPASA